MADVAGTETCARTPRRELFVVDVISDFEHCNSPLLCSWADVRPAFSTDHRRVLALVGCASLGGRILRSLRDCGYRIPAYQTEIAVHCDRHSRGAVLNRHLSFGRHHRDFPPFVLHRNSQFGFGAGRYLQCSRSGAAGSHRIRSLGKHSPHSRNS